MVIFMDMINLMSWLAGKPFRLHSTCLLEDLIMMSLQVRQVCNLQIVSPRGLLIDESPMRSLSEKVSH